MATHSSTLAWKIPRRKELVGYSLRGHKELDMTEQLSMVRRLGLLWLRIHPPVQGTQVQSLVWEDASGHLPLMCRNY